MKSGKAAKKCPSLHPPSTLPKELKPLPLVIGHRGASYNVPEHTLASYRLALELGADYIEPDLVPTKDNILIAVHSLDLNLTTDVEKKFPDRARFDVEGLTVNATSAYLTTDFTLEEIKTLRVRQRVEDTPARSRLFDYHHSIPTFQEILELVVDWNIEVVPFIDRSNTTLRPTAGVYVELKYPQFLAKNGNRSIEFLFLNELTKNSTITDYFFDQTMCENLRFDEYIRPPLVVQCFQSDVLEKLHKTMEADNVFNSSIPPMIKLVSQKSCRTEEFWFDITQETKIEGIGPDKKCILNSMNPLGFVQEAIKRGLAVHPWTERLEIEFVDENFANAEEEMTHMFCDLGIHGMFFENVGLGRKIVEKPCDLVKEIKLEKEGNTDVEEEEKIAEVLCEERVGSKSVSEFLFTCLGLLLGLVVGAFGTAWKLKPTMKSDVTLQPFEQGSDTEIL